MGRKLRVIVIDDSTYNRTTITKILDSHEDVEVIGSAEDGEKGLKLAAQEKPDLITLDIEMPRMDGFTFLRLLMSKIPTPVVMISSHSRKQEVFQALELGALDFIAKPARYFSADDEDLRSEILSKVLAVQSLQVITLSQRAQTAATGPTEAMKQELETVERKSLDRVICIGASTGGPPALQSVFRTLGPGSSSAYLVAQHMPEKFTKAFAERLHRASALEICEAENGMEVRSDCVYVAPGGSHMEIAVGAAEGRWIIRLTESKPEDRYVPSIDRLFASASQQFGDRVLGVVLTGMGADGSQGVQDVKGAGGQTLAESQETSIVFGMPKEAIETGCIDADLPLGQLIERIHEFTSNG